MDGTNYRRGVFDEAGDVTLHANMEALIKNLIDRHAALLEEACETALLTGNCGVLVTWHPDALTASVVVSPRVPYGEIWERRA